MSMFLSGTSLGRSFHVDPVKGKKGAAATEQAPIDSLKELSGKLSPGDVVYLAAGTYRESLTLSARGDAEQPIVIRNLKDQQPVMKGTTWTLVGASHLVLQGLTFEDCSPGIVFGKSASDNIVRGNQFFNCPPLGRGNYERAILGEGPDSHRNCIEGNIFKRPYEPRGNEGPEGMNVTEGNRHWRIAGNRISGYMYGLQLGIGARDNPPGYIMVADNEFFDCHEGLHIKTSDNVIRGNHIHDLRRVGWMMAGAGVFLRGGRRTTVENNRIERAEGSGIRVLGGDHLIRNNLIVDTPVGIWLSNHGYGRAGKSIRLVHNTVINAALPAWISAGEAFVFNNIFGASPGAETAILIAGIDATNPIRKMKPHWFRAYADGDDPNATFVCDYNLFHNVKPPAGQHPLIPPDHKPPVDNGWWGAHNLEGAPRFVEAAKGDYRLLPDSVGRGVGRMLPNCTRDIDGRLRPTGKPDIGAFQSSD
jgi:hypothetical protein